MNRDPWPRDEFLERLKTSGSTFYHDHHPFHQRMHSGQLSRGEVRRWISNRFYYQKNLPIKDAIVLSKLPNREDRQLWLQRIIDHDGRDGLDGGIDAWLRLGEAAGIESASMLSDSEILPGVKFAVDAYVNFCRQSSWLEAVASSLTELFAPTLISRRIEILERHYAWIDQAGLDYFKNRLEQAPRDSDHALSLVLTHATTVQLQDDVLAALKFKCDVLWSMLDAIQHGTSTRSASTLDRT
ncbi:MAG: pyrroloquinoline-quinone synthase PqqC [Candidatus Obscuribacterales bacterium]|nr:pyrroloquinoline-quinone synthase PqqC [Candidatus Obscuribacterales bacterium]